MDINNELVLQEPITFQGITIYQPTLREIFKYGIDEYNTILLPYMITADILDIPEEDKIKINIFDVIINNNQLLMYLCVSLQILCKTDSIQAFEDRVEVDGCVLNRDNFDEFSEIVLKINAKEKPKPEKLPDNPRQREIELKLRAARARIKNKNELQLCDVINIVKYGGKYYIPLDIIKDMTLWELMNAYTAKLGVSQYDDTLSIALVAGDKENKLQNLHWVKQLKISD